MNIFYVDKNPRTAAELLCDKHVVKMIVESVQMLSTCHWWYTWRKTYPIDYLRGKDIKGIHGWEHERDTRKLVYKQHSGILLPTHINHPCNIWIRENYENYKWLSLHTHGLLDEYFRRYRKHHKLEEMFNKQLLFAPSGIDLESSFTEPPLCMPNKYKYAYLFESSDICLYGIIERSDKVEAYRDFYIGEKRKFAKWKDGNIPHWFRMDDTI